MANMRSYRLVLIGVLVAIIWGLNFVVIEVALSGAPPLFLAAVRFLLTAIPAVFFVARPDVPLRWLVANGLLLGAGQFGLLFVAMERGVPAGLASVLLQSQVPVTIALGFLLLKERLRRNTIIGLVLAAAGAVLLAVGRSTSVSVFAFLLVIAAGSCWAMSNIITRIVRPGKPLPFIIWSSLAAPAPLFLLSAAIEGTDAWYNALTSSALTTLPALAYLVLLSTLLAFGLWAGLMRCHSASQVAPFSLLVPPIGLASSYFLLDERHSILAWTGAVVVMVGLAIALLPHSLITATREPETTLSDRSVRQR